MSLFHQIWKNSDKRDSCFPLEEMKKEQGQWDEKKTVGGEKMVELHRKEVEWIIHKGDAKSEWLREKF